MAWRDSLNRLGVGTAWYLIRKHPRLMQRIVSISVSAPWWRDRAIINMLWSLRWLKPVLKAILTDTGKDRFEQWFDHNYSRAALVKKYPWLKYYRK